MRPSPRAAVSTYIEVFLLIALAAGGSGLVFGAGLGVASSAGGPGVSLADATIRQGEYVAVERVAIYNTGKAPFSFALSTTRVSSSATYCYTLYDPSGAAVVATTCPGAAPDAATVDIPTSLVPGKGVLLALTISGRAFALGSECDLTVTTSAGAQGSVAATVLPA